MVCQRYPAKICHIINFSFMKRFRPSFINHSIQLNFFKLCGSLSEFLINPIRFVILSIHLRSSSAPFHGKWQNVFIFIYYDHVSSNTLLASKAELMEHHIPFLPTKPAQRSVTNRSLNNTAMKSISLFSFFTFFNHHKNEKPERERGKNIVKMFQKWVR